MHHRKVLTLYRPTPLVYIIGLNIFQMSVSDDSVSIICISEHGRISPIGTPARRRRAVGSTGSHLCLSPQPPPPPVHYIAAFCVFSYLDTIAKKRFLVCLFFCVFSPASLFLSCFVLWSDTYQDVYTPAQITLSAHENSSRSSLSCINFMEWKRVTCFREWI